MRAGRRPIEYRLSRGNGWLAGSARLSEEVELGRRGPHFAACERPAPRSPSAPLFHSALHRLRGAEVNRPRSARRHWPTRHTMASDLGCSVRQAAAKAKGPPRRVSASWLLTYRRQRRVCCSPEDQRPINGGSTRYRARAGPPLLSKRFLLIVSSLVLVAGSRPPDTGGKVS